MLKSNKLDFKYRNPTWTRSQEGTGIALGYDPSSLSHSGHPTSCRNVSQGRNPSRSRSPSSTRSPTGIRSP